MAGRLALRMLTGLLLLAFLGRPVSASGPAPAARYLIASFTTAVVVAEPGRVRNITLAAAKIHDTIIAPGETFSFNDRVGPRDAEHGWAQANELYQGEYVLGFGGGICQVTSTLYNAVLLGGLQVLERYHHDRPLQYIDPGRDATVVWNLLDFKFRNTLQTAIWVEARIRPGSPQVVEVGIYALEPVAVGKVRVEETLLRYFPPDLKEIPDPTLPPGARRVVDEGDYGIEVLVHRIRRDDRGERREQVSHDLYHPKPGKVQVGISDSK